MTNHPAFSLVVCTVDRTDELARLFGSLAAQTFRDFEVLVVDQNEDQRLAPILDRHANDFPIRHLTSQRGLSRARNVGLQAARGELIAFPDDDCWYSDGLVENVVASFRAHAGIHGISARRDGNPQLPHPLSLSVRNVWGRVASYTLFARREVYDAIGGFDESLGVGAGTPWGAGEDTDWVLRSLARGMKWMHDPALAVFHPPHHRGTGPADIVRARSYARGLGRVLRKNRVPLWMVAGGVGLSIARTTRSLLRRDVEEARINCAELEGRIAGWLPSPGARGEVSFGRRG